MGGVWCPRSKEGRNLTSPQLLPLVGGISRCQGPGHWAEGLWALDITISPPGKAKAHFYWLTLAKSTCPTPEKREGGAGTASPQSDNSLH